MQVMKVTIENFTQFTALFNPCCGNRRVINGSDPVVPPSHESDVHTSTIVSFKKINTTTSRIVKDIHILSSIITDKNIQVQF